MLPLLLSSFISCSHPAAPPPLAALEARLPPAVLDAPLRAKLTHARQALVLTRREIAVVPLHSTTTTSSSPSTLLAAPLELALSEGRLSASELRGNLVTRLYDTLVDQADGLKSLGAQAGTPFTGELWIFAARDATPETLRQIVYTAGQAQFGRQQLVAFGAAAATPVLEPSTPSEPATPTARPHPTEGLRIATISNGSRAHPKQGPPLPPVRVQIDDRGASFRVTLPTDPHFGGSLDVARLLLDTDDPQLFPSFSAARAAAAWPVLPSLEMLGHASKIADDTLMKALVREQNATRNRWLTRLLTLSDSADVRRWVQTALLLADQPLPSAPLPEAQAQAQRFLSQPGMARPSGIYNDADDLRASYRRDRWLSRPLLRIDPTQWSLAAQLAATLSAHSDLSEALREMADRDAKLTNPSNQQGLWAWPPPDDVEQVSLLPPARSAETALMAARGGTASVTSPMQAMVDAVKDGSLDLRPQPDSGWLDHQLWALAPLLTLPENDIVHAGPHYIERLEHAFKSSLAMRRETHIKSIDLPTLGASPQLEVRVAPSLRVEPVPTHYARSAQAEAFLLGQLRPERDDIAPVRAAQTRYQDVEAIARADLGLQAPTRDVSATLDWLERWPDNPVFSKDVRFMVPFGEDAAGHTIGWGVVGIRTLDIVVAYDRKPVVTSRDDVALKVSFVPQRYTLLIPVFAEFQTQSVYDRAAFQRLADAQPSLSALLRALKG